MRMLLALVAGINLFFANAFPAQAMSKEEAENCALEISQSINGASIGTVMSWLDIDQMLTVARRGWKKLPENQKKILREQATTEIVNDIIPTLQGYNVASFSINDIVESKSGDKPSWRVEGTINGDEAIITLAANGNTCLIYNASYLSYSFIENIRQRIKMVSLE